MRKGGKMGGEESNTRGWEGKGGEDIVREGKRRVEGEKRGIR